MSKCPKCGKEVKDGAKFCTKCGTKIMSLSPELAAQIDILKKRIEKDSLNPKLYEQLGEIYEQNYLLPEALVEYQKAVNIDESYFDAHLRSGEIYLTLEELEKAETSFKRALSLVPESKEAGLGLFRVYHLRRKAEEGLKLGEELVQADPNNLEVHKALKEMYAEKGMSEEVFRELLTITALAPHDKESFEELAGFYREKGDVENEIKCHQKVLELDPKDVVSRFSLGKAFCLKGEYQKAIEHLKDIVEEMEHPYESYGHLYLSLAYVSQQNLDNAIQEIGLVSPLDYEEPTVSDKKLLAEAYYKIGCAVFQKHNLSSAIDYLQKATKYEPSNEEYRQQLETAKSEQASLKRKIKKRSLTFALSVTAAIVIMVAGWYLSHGKIQLGIIPADNVKLYVDGKPVKWAIDSSAGFIISPSLFFGVHKITIEKYGYEKWEKNIRIGYGRMVNIEAELVPIYGSLRVDSSPQGAGVFLDTQTIGKTPLFKDSIPIGERLLEIQKPGYIPFSSKITCQKEELLDLGIIRLKEYAHLKVNSHPNNAEAFIDGKYYNRTPFKVEMLPGAHDLLVKKDYYRTRNEKINLLNGENKTLSISLPQFEGIWEGKWKPGIYESKYMTLVIQQDRDRLTVQCDELTHYCKVNDRIDFSVLGSSPVEFWHPVIGKVPITKNNSYGFQIKWSKEIDDWPYVRRDDHNLICFIAPDGKHLVGIEKEMSYYKGGEPVYFDLINEKPASTTKSTSIGVQEPQQIEFPRTFKIPADQEWTYTRIKLSAGQELRIELVGKINHGCSDCEAGPNGGKRKCGRYQCGAVIGKIGSNGESFLVGERYTGIVSEQGMLYLGVVDTKYSDNRGEFTATISLK